MKTKNLSPLARRLAKAGITLAALGVFALLRPDVIGWLRDKAVSYYGQHFGSPRVISEYLRTHSTRKLQLGAGTFDRPGWLNTDIEPRAGQAYLDVTKPFPLPEGSMQVVFSEHLIEHVPYEDGLKMLKECHRVLGPGGGVRIATPNLMKFVELFAEPKSEAVTRFIQNKVAWHEWPRTADPECLILNWQLRFWGHQFVYTPKMLRASLERAGFTDIKEFRSGESDRADMAGLEARPGSSIGDVNAYETMVFQAVRR
jgi:predicted SAM-dependent methyltransferase